MSDYKFNYKLIIEYNGSFFHGWQKQKGLVTVQSELERAIHTALHRNDISALQAAGRTDSGVHALGQVVNFKSNFEIDLYRLKHAVSNILKNKVSVLSAESVPLSFNALHSAIARQYRYIILNRASPAVLDYAKVWHVVYPLDFDKLKLDAKKLEGTLDCSSFRSAGCLSKSSIKTIMDSIITKENDYIIYTIKGNGFLKQMVRNIVGTLVQLNKKCLKFKEIEQIIEAKDRSYAGSTAPAYGLYLEKVYY